MARQVNIYTNGWAATGKNINVPQYSVNVRLDWIDDEGLPHTRSETMLFPNFLSRVGAASLKEWLTDLMLREAQQRLVN